MKYCTNCVSPSSAPLPGKTSSNGCYYALRQNKNIISASNSSPSHSLTLESFAQVKTCNQFYLTASIFAQAWSAMQAGLSQTLQLHSQSALHRDAVERTAD